MPRGIVSLCDSTRTTKIAQGISGSCAGLRIIDGGHVTTARNALQGTEAGWERWIPEYQIHPNTVFQVSTLTYIAAAPQSEASYYQEILGYKPKT